MAVLAALFINISIVICELYTLRGIRKKGDILKYYTYLQNLLALIVSLAFCVCVVLHLAGGRAIPEFIMGLRYVATCGLAATMFIFVAFLGAGKKIAITEDDFLPGYSPRTANIILHYVCPVLSVLSFVVFERGIGLSNGIWTAIAPIPSCVYWIAYFILSAAKLWEEPYDFASEGKGALAEILTVLLIPLSFIAISFILWNIK